MAIGDWDFTYGPMMPLSKETDTTYGGGKPGKAPTQKQPKAPDPFMLIEEQGKVNRPDQIGPLRSTRFRKGDDGYWTETTEFSPQLQRLFDQRIGLVGEDVPVPNQPSDSDFAAEGDKLEQATYQKLTNLMNPQFEEEQNRLTSDLANRGIMMGSEAYNKELDNYNRRKNQAYTQAGLEAVGAGRQEQGRLFGQGLSAREQGFRQNISRRQQLYNELASLMGTAQIGKPTELDVMGPFSQQYAGQVAGVNAANQNAAQRNAQTTSGAASLAMILASMFSDRRLKTDIQKIDQLPSGLNVYRFKYIWDEDVYHVGVMADEVEKIFPEAVGEMYGFKTVDYGRIH